MACCTNEVVANLSSSNLQSHLSRTEIESLLKQGAYALMNSTDSVSNDFCDEDIDQILARRSLVIQHGNEPLKDGGSLFSKGFPLLHSHCCQLRSLWSAILTPRPS